MRRHRFGDRSLRWRRRCGWGVGAGGSEIQGTGGSDSQGAGGGEVGGAAGSSTTAKGGNGGSGAAGSAATGKGGTGTAGSTGKGGTGAAGSGAAGTGAGGSGAAGGPSCADCSSLSAPCSMGVCSAGKCVAQPLPAGTSCSDGDACTIGDACDAGGVCTAGTPKSCGFPPICHTAICDPQTGNCNQGASPNGTPCDDGNPMTTGDVCTSGACAGKPPVDDVRLRIVEVSTDAADYVILENIGTTAGNISLYHLGFSAASNVPSTYLDGYEFTLPNRVLQPQERVILVEPEGTPKTGEIPLSNNLWWWWDGAGAWLCKGACTTASVVDAFWFGALKLPPPAGISFLPAIAGNPAGQPPNPTFLRKAFSGMPPAPAASEWQMGQPTRP